MILRDLSKELGLTVNPPEDPNHPFWVKIFGKYAIDHGWNPDELTPAQVEEIHRECMKKGCH